MKITNFKCAEILSEAIAKLGEAASLLNELYDDARVKYILSELEGLDKGWFHVTDDDPDYLIDILQDVLLEARGLPLKDQWSGRTLTQERGSLPRGTGVRNTMITYFKSKEILSEAIAKLGDAAILLRGLDRDDRVLYVLADLEGMDNGCFHGSRDDQDFLVDMLEDLLLESRGLQLMNHWRGHPLTQEEAWSLLQHRGRIEGADLSEAHASTVGYGNSSGTPHDG